LNYYLKQIDDMKNEEKAKGINWRC